MQTIHLNETFREPTPCVATIGMFDGVHRGHRFVIDCLRQEAARLGLPSCVITFDRHPRLTLSTNHSPLTNHQLSTLDEKLVLLSQTGIDLCVVLPFTQEMAALPAYDFMQQVLKEQLKVQVLLTGYDNHFGHRGERAEGFDDYQRYGRELGIEVKALEPLSTHQSPHTTHYSSSLVRRLLIEGRIAEANEALGYPYFVLGTVVRGEHIGTNIGFPTANLQPDDANKLIPANGVYAVRVRLEDSLEQKHGMTNIGRRPTFTPTTTQQPPLTIETHILRHDGVLYGQRMMVSFIHRMRDEQSFEGPEALVAQLRQDAATAEELLNQDIEE